MKDWKNQLNRLLGTGFFHVFGSSVVNNLAAFAANVLLVHILSKREYGVFVCAWNIYTIAALTDGLGIGAGLLQVCSERSGELGAVKRYCSYGARVGMGFDILLAAVLLGLGLYLPLEISGANGLLRMLCLFPLVQLPYSMVISCLRAARENRKFARLTMINTVSILLCTVLGAIFLREKGMVLGYYAAYLLTLGAASRMVSPALFLSREKPERQQRKSLLSISVVSMCCNGLSQLLYLLDVFVLGLVSGEETLLAGYKVAAAIPTALSFIPTAAATYLYPYFAAHRGDGRWCLRSFRRTLGITGCIHGLISLFLVLGAPLVIRLIYGGRYLDAVPVFRILSVSFFFSATFRTIPGVLLATQRKLRFNLAVAVMAGIVNIAADYILITRWGAPGAACATAGIVLLTGALNTGYLIHTLRKQKNTGD